MGCGVLDVSHLSAEAMPIRNMLSRKYLTHSVMIIPDSLCRQAVPVSGLRHGIFCRPCRRTTIRMCTRQAP